MRYLLVLSVLISSIGWSSAKGNALEWSEFESKVLKEKDFYKRLALFQRKEEQIHSIEKKGLNSKKGKLKDGAILNQMALWSFTAQKVDLSTVTRTTCSDRIEKVFSELGVDQDERSDFSQTVKKHFRILCSSQ